MLDFIEIIKVIFLGIVEGITEWLPISSTGHMLLVDEFIKMNVSADFKEMENFAGCAVVVSHDRWFLDRIATHILAFEGDSKVVYFEGSYSEYEESKRKRLGDVTPKRIRYKKLIG